MIDTGKWLERFLQKQRFKRVIPHLKGDVLDFGGNEGELKQLVTGSYLCVNYDHSVMDGAEPDTIISLAVVEHIHVEDVYAVFRRFKKMLRSDGHIFLTTPTPASKPVLEFLARIGLLDKENIEEHKHYWTRHDLNELAVKTGFEMVRYRKFQLGFNQWALMKHAKDDPSAGQDNRL